jgi:transglutaminase-like putative cysteine protease
MADGDPLEPGPVARTVSCGISFLVAEPAEVVVQVMASASAGQAEHEQLEVLVDGEPPSSCHELRDGQGATMHIIRSAPGQLTVHYEARILAPPAPAAGAPGEYERQVYLRASRYCPSDLLTGFAVAEFGTERDSGGRGAAISEWIRLRTGYVPGSGSVHDSAEHTLLTGVGTCRDFAHLGIALCRATGIPARFAAVYAPGLFPMDFHAVFETLEAGRWCVHDPTGLAPRQSLVRVVTGRDAADTAFAAVTTGIADLAGVEVSAIAEPTLPVDDVTQDVELA